MTTHAIGCLDLDDTHRGVCRTSPKHPLASLRVDWECDLCGKKVQATLERDPAGWVEHNIDDGDADDDTLCETCAPPAPTPDFTVEVINGAIWIFHPAASISLTRAQAVAVGVAGASVGAA